MTPAESVSAAQPGGIDLPFDPRAKEDLPFELPDDTRSPLSFAPQPPEPAPFEPPLAVPPTLAAPPPLPAAADFPVVPPVEELPEAQPAPLFEVETEVKTTFHVLCPSGHKLEVTRDMLGKEAMCPYCQKQFMVQVGRSLEFQRKRAQPQSPAKREN